MNKEFKTCPLSGYTIKTTNLDITSDNRFFFVETPYKKEFIYYGLTSTFIDLVLPSLTGEEKFRLWCVLLERDFFGFKSFVITTDAVKASEHEKKYWISCPYTEILKMFPTTNNILQRILGMHIALGNISGELFGCNRFHYSANKTEIYFNQNAQIVDSLLNEIASRGFLNVSRQNDYVFTTITLKGLDYYNGIVGTIDSNICFVAMKFGEGDDKRNMNDFFNTVIKPTVDSVKPFEAKIVSSDRTGDKICDKIIADIRKSKFLIVDLTHSNNGAYFEAGFAHALNKEIIYICERKWFQDGHYNVKEGEKPYTIQNKGKPLGIHFDIEHYPVTQYDPTDEGYEILKDEIIAQIESRVLK